jgi:hypothetical protein
MKVNNKLGAIIEEIASRKDLPGIQIATDNNIH